MKRFKVKLLRLLLPKLLLRALPDRAFIKLKCLKKDGFLPDLRNPRTFNEKLQWYKLYYRDPLMTRMADKYEVRKFLEDKGFSGLLNELYGVYDSVKDIDFNRFPNSFVLKATHGTAMNIICKNKADLDLEKCCAVMNGWLKKNHFSLDREWSYKNIRPRLICEKFLENEAYSELLDYKFYCFNGKPTAVFVCDGRYCKRGVRYNAYDLDWNRLNVTKGKPASDLYIDKPKKFTDMINIAGQLSQGFPFLRVDFYEVEGRIFFGELTFYPSGGFRPFKPDSYNYVWGDLFVLPGKH